MCCSDTCLTPVSLTSLFQVVYVVLSVCLAAFCVLKLGQQEVCEKILDNVSGDSVIVYGKVCLWVLVLVFTTCAERHHSRVRRRGYLQFCRETQGLHWQPLAFLSTGRVLLPTAESEMSIFVHRVAVMLKYNLCWSFPGNVLILLLLAAQLSHPLQIYILLSILCLELLVVVPCLCYYTGNLTLNL